MDRNGANITEIGTSIGMDRESCFACMLWMGMRVLMKRNHQKPGSKKQSENEGYVLFSPFHEISNTLVSLDFVD